MLISQDVVRRDMLKAKDGEDTSALHLLKELLKYGRNNSDELTGYTDSISNGVTDVYIQDLMVHPNYQGKGIGTELMNRMIAYMKEKHIYMVSVIRECGDTCGSSWKRLCREIRRHLYSG